MPIRAEYRRFYRGAAWREARERVRARAGDCCESCGVKNGVYATRLGGLWWDDAHHQWRGTPGPAPFRRVRIVCTTAHKNHKAGDDRDENLLFLCQYCHLRLDLAEHKRSRSERKDRARPLLQEVV